MNPLTVTYCLNSHNQTVSALALSVPDVNFLASVDEDGKLLVFDANSRSSQPIWSMDCIASANDESSTQQTNGLPFSTGAVHNGTTTDFASTSSADADHHPSPTALSEASALSPSQYIVASSNEVYSNGTADADSITISPCGALLFAKSAAYTLYATRYKSVLGWDVRQPGRLLCSWQVGKEELNSLDLLENENRLAVADDSGDIHIVDTLSGSLVRSLSKHDNIVSAVKFRPNRPWQLISGGLDSRLVVSEWRGKSGLAVTIFEMSELLDQTEDDLLEMLSSGEIQDASFCVGLPMIQCLDCTTSGNVIACGLKNGSVELFSGSGKNLIHQESLFGHTRSVACVHCVEENFMISGGDDKNMLFWQLTPEGQNCQFQHSHKIACIAAHSLERVFFSDTTQTISVVDLTTL